MVREICLHYVEKCTGKFTDNKQSTETLIPEAFNVSITLKSLLPETKNLFLNSYNTSVTTSTE